MVGEEGVGEGVGKGDEDGGREGGGEGVGKGDDDGGGHGGGGRRWEGVGEGDEDGGGDGDKDVGQVGSADHKEPRPIPPALPTDRKQAELHL